MIARMNALKIFYSYAHENEALKDELMRHLAVLRHENLVNEWHDGRIDPGAMWDQEIRAQLAAADIILFLVSSDFLSSRYINDTEIREALERHARDEATLIPIILRPA